MEQYLADSWGQPVLRSLGLGVLWLLSGCRGPGAIVGWPWLLWLWQAVAVGWPELSRQPLWSAGRWLLWQGQRVLLVGYVGLALYQARGAAEEEIAFGPPARGILLGLGCQQCDHQEPWVEVTGREDGGYQATLCGHFTLQVSGDDPFRARLLMLFLRLLEVPAHQRGSRRTRDGRTPFVRQRQVAAWFKKPQPDISRVEGYWLRGAWPQLLSQCTPELLTPELVRRVVTVCATFPLWSQERVYRYLQSQGLRVTQRQVRQAIEQSGGLSQRIAQPR
jgi:hypothetical protein